MARNEYPAERRRLKFAKWKARKRQQKHKQMLTAGDGAGTDEVICLDPSDGEEGRPIFTVRRTEELIRHTGPSEGVVLISSDDEPVESPMKHCEPHFEPDVIQLHDSNDNPNSDVPNTPLARPSEDENTLAKSGIPFRIRTTAELIETRPHPPTVSPTDRLWPNTYEVGSRCQELLPSSSDYNCTRFEPGGFHIGAEVLATIQPPDCQPRLEFLETTPMELENRQIDSQGPFLNRNPQDLSNGESNDQHGIRPSGIMQRYLEISSSQSSQQIENSNDPAQTVLLVEEMDSTLAPQGHLMKSSVYPPAECETLGQLPEQWHNVGMSTRHLKFHSARRPLPWKRTPESIADQNLSSDHSAGLSRCRRPNVNPEIDVSSMPFHTMSKAALSDRLKEISKQVENVNMVLHKCKKMQKKYHGSKDLARARMLQPVPVILDLPSLNYYSTDPIPPPGHEHFHLYRTHVRHLLSQLVKMLRQGKKMKKLLNRREDQGKFDKNKLIRRNGKSRLSRGAKFDLSQSHGNFVDDVISERVSGQLGRPGPTTEIPQSGSGSVHPLILILSAHPESCKSPQAVEVRATDPSRETGKVRDSSGLSNIPGPSPKPLAKTEPQPEGHGIEPRITGQVSVFASKPIQSISKCAKSPQVVEVRATDLTRETGKVRAFAADDESGLSNVPGPSPKPLAKTEAQPEGDGIEPQITGQVLVFASKPIQSISKCAETPADPQAESCQSPQVVEFRATDLTRETGKVRAVAADDESGFSNVPEFSPQSLTETESQPKGDGIEPRITGQVSVFASKPIQSVSDCAKTPAAPQAESCESFKPLVSEPTASVKDGIHDRSPTTPKLPWTALSNTSWDALFR